MKNNKNTSYIIIAAIVFLVLIAIVVASIMTKCGGSDNINETNATVETTVGMQILGSIAPTDENGSTISSNEDSESNSTSNTIESSQSDNGNNSGSDSNNTANSNNNGSNSQNANNNSNNSSTKVCTVDGNKYNIGDTVTCTFKLKTPETLENYQGNISYDSKYLKVKNAKFGKPASSGGVLNYKNVKNQIVFNGSNITTGYDYTNGGTFMTVTYEVVAEGNTSTSFNWQTARGFSGDNKKYVNNGKADSGLVVTKEFS